MEVDRISSMIQQAGYNPFGVSGTSDQDAMKLAQENGITVEEAKEVLKEAEEKAKQLDLQFQDNTNVLDVLNAQDEEELVAFDDKEFDDFLSQTSAESQMQNMLNMQQFTSQNNTVNAQNMFAQGNNPFLKNRA